MKRDDPLPHFSVNINLLLVHLFNHVLADKWQQAPEAGGFMECNLKLRPCCSLADFPPSVRRWLQSWASAQQGSLVDSLSPGEISSLPPLPPTTVAAALTGLLGF